MLKRDIYPRNHGPITAASLATIALVGAYFFDKAPEPTSPRVAPTHIASLSHTPGKNDSKGKNVYQVEFNKNGTIYGALTAFAIAEGMNPNTTAVSEGLASESNYIAGQIAAEKVSPQSLGQVDPGTTIYVSPGSKIQNPEALQSVSGAVIKRAQQ
jgi:hypothetical protein